MEQYKSKDIKALWAEEKYTEKEYKGYCFYENMQRGKISITAVPVITS